MLVLLHGTHIDIACFILVWGIPSQVIARSGKSSREPLAPGEVRLFRFGREIHERLEVFISQIDLNRDIPDDKKEQVDAYRPYPNGQEIRHPTLNWLRHVNTRLKESEPETYNKPYVGVGATEEFRDKTLRGRYQRLPPLAQHVFLVLLACLLGLFIRGIFKVLLRLVRTYTHNSAAAGGTAPGHRVMKSISTTIP